MDLYDLLVSTQRLSSNADLYDNLPDLIPRPRAPGREATAAARRSGMQPVAVDVTVIATNATRRLSSTESSVAHGS